MKNRFINFIEKVLVVIKRPDMEILPGQLAFFFVLSVVPIVTVISYGASFLHLPVNFISNFIGKAFGSDVALLIEPMVSISNIDFRFFFTLIVGYYIASNGAASIIITSNAIYDIPNSGFLKRRIKAIIMTFFIVLLFMFILIVPVFGKNIIEMITFVNMNETITKTITFAFRLLKGPIAWFIMFCFIKIIYTMAPDRKLSSMYVNYGALFTTIMWVIVTAVYSYYINNFANYAVFYGGLANLVMLMLWVYFLSYVFVIGMALNKKEEITKLEKIGVINIPKE